MDHLWYSGLQPHRLKPSSLQFGKQEGEKTYRIKKNKFNREKKLIILKKSTEFYCPAINLRLKRAKQSAALILSIDFARWIVLCESWAHAHHLPLLSLLSKSFVSLSFDLSVIVDCFCSNSVDTLFQTLLAVSISDSTVSSLPMPYACCVCCCSLILSTRTTASS